MAEGRYRVSINDRMTGRVVYTSQWYNGYQGAHEAAEAACRRKYGRDNARYEIVDCDD